MTDSEYNGKKVIIYLKVTQAAKHILPHKLIVKTYVKLVVIIGRGSQKFLFDGPTYNTNLLAYTNFHKHAQTYTSIHTHNLVSFIVNLQSFYF